MVFTWTALTECLDTLTEAMDYSALRDGQQRLREQGVWRGIGIITFIEQTAVGPGLYGAANVPATSVEECRIRLEADGCIRVETGATDQGQGTLTEFGRSLLRNWVSTSRLWTLFLPIVGGKRRWGLGITGPLLGKRL